MQKNNNGDFPSLENLIEEEDIDIEILHPGGLEITDELAEMCGIESDMKTLDVASGSGASAIFLAENYGCSIVGLESSKLMVKKARSKVREKEVNAEFLRGDAHRLPFQNESFDVVISECTLCLLDKNRAIEEMVRVVKPGGCVGIHDICWKDDTPDNLKRKLAELEHEKPETVAGWKKLFREAGLRRVKAEKKFEIMSDWMEKMKEELGYLGQLKIFLKILRRWGFSGLKRVRESQKIFEDERTGYGIVIGRKP